MAPPQARVDAYAAAASRFRELASSGDIEGACEVLRSYIVEEKRVLSKNRARGMLGQALWQAEDAGGALQVLDEGLAQLVSDTSEAERAVTAAEDSERTQAIRAHLPQYQSLIAYLYIQRGRAFLLLGLLDKASDDLSLAKHILEALGPSGTDIRAEIGAMRRFEAEVLMKREAWVDLESAVDAYLASDDAKNPSGRLLAAQLNVDLGVGLAEAARTDPAHWGAKARARLERSLAGPELPATERVHPELALFDLDLNAGNAAAARARLAQADAHLGHGSGRASNTAYVTFEAARAELLLAGNSPVGMEALRDELAGLLRHLVDDFGKLELRPGGYGFLNSKNKRALLSELFRLEMTLTPGAAGRQRALDHLLSLGPATYLGRKLGCQPVDVTRARSVLLAGRAGSALVVYLPAPNRSHAFFVDAERIEHFELPCRDVLEAKRFEAVKELRNPPPENAKGKRALPDTTALAKVLLPSGLQAWLRKCSCISIVGRDLLGEVPFEALPLEDGQALGVSKALTDLPSVAAGIALVERARAERRLSADGAPGAIRLVGAPVVASLKVRPEDLEAMLGAWPSTARVLRTGKDATFAALKDLPDPTCVLQIFTHGKLDWEREEPATFQLQGATEEAGFWCGAEELREVPMPSLVLLTVCGADMMPRRRGDGGAAGFAGTFFASGTRTRCVVLSAYDIDTAAARELSRRFYAALVSGEDPAEAMRQARAELAAAPGFGDPFYYGLLRVVGAGHEPLFERKR